MTNFIFDSMPVSWPFLWRKARENLSCQSNARDGQGKFMWHTNVSNVGRCLTSLFLIETSVHQWPALALKALAVILVQDLLYHSEIMRPDKEEKETDGGKTILNNIRKLVYYISSALTYLYSKGSLCVSSKLRKKIKKGSRMVLIINKCENCNRK